MCDINYVGSLPTTAKVKAYIIVVMNYITRLLFLLKWITGISWEDGSNPNNGMYWKTY